MWRLLPLVLAVAIGGCSVPELRPEAQGVRIYVNEDSVGDCTYLGEVYGSAGHWYNSWLIANKTLTRGAISDLKNDAEAMGADSLLIPPHVPFQTSVTFLALAYRCD